MDRDNKTYEINYLMTPLVTEDKIAEETSVLRKIIEDNKGLVMGEDQPKMQKLSYFIKKFDKAYYGWLKLSAGTGSIDNIKNSFNKNEKILRALVTEAGKENAAQFAPRYGAAAPKQEAPSPETTEKIEINPEQIDEKLAEILKESSS